MDRSGNSKKPRSSWYTGGIARGAYQLYRSLFPASQYGILTSSIALILRVLHRVRYLSEQTTFDVATYSYLSPLLKQILMNGGIGLTEEDDPLEQVSLALDLIKFHCGDFG